MKNWNDENLLEVIEMLAEEMGYISSENELSELFDNMLNESGGFDETDTIAINEDFNNWSDQLCKNGEIHIEQYDNYAYVGKYSE